MARTQRKKKRTHVREEHDPAKKGPPKSFVFWRGQHGLVLKALEADLRKLMQPHTATNLKETKRNQLKDFVNIAGPLGVTQFLILTATEKSCYLRIGRVPRGPTLTMHIRQYSLMRDVVASQARPSIPSRLWKTSPLVVLNNFAGQEHLKLATLLFQNLFPAINVQTANLSSCQRVVLLNYDKEADMISFRHFSISVTPSGVTKSMKELVSKRRVPDMGDLQDVAEFLTKSGFGSESEGEDAAASRVTLAQDMGRGNLASRQSRIRLQEIGPRMELEIVKAEEGLCNGKVLYHRHIKKTAQEVAEQTQAIKTRAELREQRRRQQEENVNRKAALKRKAEEEGGKEGKNSLPGRKKRKKEWWEEETRRATEEDNDLEYYQQEVGESPDDVYGFKSGPRGKDKNLGVKARSRATPGAHRWGVKPGGKAKGITKAKAEQPVSIQDRRPKRRKK